MILPRTAGASCTALIVASCANAVNGSAMAARNQPRNVRIGLALLNKIIEVNNYQTPILPISQLTAQLSFLKVEININEA
jgi:hypothetical protein